jgi:hypothetical protein
MTRYKLFESIGIEPMSKFVTLIVNSAGNDVSKFSLGKIDSVSPTDFERYGPSSPYGMKHTVWT